MDTVFKGISNDEFYVWHPFIDYDLFSLQLDNVDEAPEMYH